MEVVFFCLTLFDLENSNMIDTIKIIITPNDVNKPWNVDEIKNRLMSADKYKRRGFNPSGLIRNMSVCVSEKSIYIEGSVAKYLNTSNMVNFDFRDLKLAIMKLSEELGVELLNAKILRIDIAANFELKNEICDYFPELHSLKYFQRDTSKRTTLRFYSNTDRNNLVFYDKIKEFKSKNKNKLLKDDSSIIDTFGNLMRYEFMLQRSPSKYLKISDLRVKDLLDPKNCKIILRLWYDMYESIHKRSSLEYPNIKGLKGFETQMKRYLIYDLGWELIESELKKAVGKKLISASDKSKKLKQFDIALKSKKGFKFTQNTRELNHKMKVMYVKGLMQIFKMDPKSVEF